MGIDVKFVRVAQEELQSLLDGEMEVDDLEPSPLSLPRNANGQIDTDVRLAFKYAQGGWETVAAEATKLKMSEDDLKVQVKKCGMHIWLDTSRQWNELHILLAGESAHERLKSRTESGDGSGDILSSALIGGRMVEDDSSCFGSFGAAYLSPAQVQAIAAKLESLTYEALSAKNKVNTGIDEESMRQLFEQFTKFFAEASRDGQAVVRHTG